VNLRGVKRKSTSTGKTWDLIHRLSARSWTGVFDNVERKAGITMADKEESKQKVTIICKDPETAKFLDKPLSGVSAEWVMGLKETKGSTFRGEIEKLPVRFSFKDVTVREALTFACRGQSFRVALQGWLRGRTRQAVESDGTVVKTLRSLLDRKRASGPQDPVKVAGNAVTKMTREQKLALLKKLQEETMEVKEG